MKTCTKCLSNKEITDFYSANDSWCKTCRYVSEKNRKIRKKKYDNIPNSVFEARKNLCFDKGCRWVDVVLRRGKQKNHNSFDRERIEKIKVEIDNPEYQKHAINMLAGRLMRIIDYDIQEGT